MRVFLWAVCVGSLLVSAARGADGPDHLQGEMAGEVTAESAILHSRLTGPKIDEQGDVMGAPGAARFEWSASEDFASPQQSEWVVARPEDDFIIRSQLAGLQPGTRYFYRLVFGPDREQIERGPTRTFRTLPAADTAAPVRFVVVTGMNYAFFHHGRDGRGSNAYDGEDKHLGYPALASILEREPDFFVGTGDNVYYDHPAALPAQTAQAMRKKWHEQFVQPRFVDLFARVPTYWQKDDHDHRYNDSDNTGDRPPSTALGTRIFREQVPVAPPGDEEAVTYRTHRIGRLVQIWLLEGRDYRSPNASPDGPGKTIWGAEQRAWLQATLKASDAPLKLVISPTPMIGPDNRGKRDNHVNLHGFRHERDAFFDWAKQEGLIDRGLYLICGDRHWQYHAIDPSGMEEFSCGALVDANAIVGLFPGDRNSTDPEGTIRHAFHPRESSGGFLEVVVEPDGDHAARASFNFFDEQGKLLYTVEKRAVTN